MEFALGILAALIGAGGAFAGALLSGRHERQLEHERWSRTRRGAANDARAAAIASLTKHLASALQTAVWFSAAAQMRAPLFSEKTIIDYDAEMRGHITAATESLVGVAYHDHEAFLELERLASEVFELDGQLAGYAASYWTDPETARLKIGSTLGSAYRQMLQLPHAIAAIQLRDEAARESSMSASDLVGSTRR